MQRRHVGRSSVGGLMACLAMSAGAACGGGEGGGATSNSSKAASAGAVCIPGRSGRVRVPWRRTGRAGLQCQRDGAWSVRGVQRNRNGRSACGLLNLRRVENEARVVLIQKRVVCVQLI